MKSASVTLNCFYWASNTVCNFNCTVAVLHLVETTERELSLWFFQSLTLGLALPMAEYWTVPLYFHLSLYFLPLSQLRCSPGRIFVELWITSQPFHLRKADKYWIWKNSQRVCLLNWKLQIDFPTAESSSSIASLLKIALQNPYSII